MEIKIFESAKFGTVRTMVNEKNEPLFCLSDVCKVLDIKNPSDAKSRLKRDGVVTTEGVSTTVNQYGKSTQQTVQLTFVTEPNLYRLIFMSRKAEADAFQDWVCGEVLPEIRKNGGYMIANDDESEEDLMARALKVADETIKRQKERLRLQQQTIENQQQYIDENKNKVLFAESVSSSDGTILIRNFVKIVERVGIKIGEKQLFKLLRECKILDKNNFPMRRYIDRGDFVIQERVILSDKGSRLAYTPRLTGKGQVNLSNWLIKLNEKNGNKLFKTDKK